MSLKSKSTAGVATVYWEHSYAGTCNTRTWAIKKNGIILALGTGATGASGSFTVVNGDTIAVDSSSGVTGVDCNDAKAAVYRDGTDVASQTVTGLNQTASATWTVATVSATYNLISGFIVP
jgi:co-chaperonin GroES (HSP10)